MAPVLRDMVLIVECVFLEFTGQCQESGTFRDSLSLTTKACAHPHICSHSCLTKAYFLKKGCGTSVETERNVIYVLGSQEFCTVSKSRKKSAKVTQIYACVKKAQSESNLARPCSETLTHYRNTVQERFKLSYHRVNTFKFKSFFDFDLILVIDHHFDINN